MGTLRRLLKTVAQLCVILSCVNSNSSLPTTREKGERDRILPQQQPISGDSKLYGTEPYQLHFLQPSHPQTHHQSYYPSPTAKRQNSNIPAPDYASAQQRPHQPYRHDHLPPQRQRTNNQEDYDPFYFSARNGVPPTGSRNRRHSKVRELFGSGSDEFSNHLLNEDVHFFRRGKPVSGTGFDRSNLIGYERPSGSAFDRSNMIGYERPSGSGFERPNLIGYERPSGYDRSRHGLGSSGSSTETLLRYHKDRHRLPLYESPSQFPSPFGRHEHDPYSTLNTADRRSPLGSNHLDFFDTYRPHQPHIPKLFVPEPERFAREPIEGWSVQVGTQLRVHDDGREGNPAQYYVRDEKPANTRRYPHRHDYVRS